MKLYQHPQSHNCRKVLAVLQHLDIECELETVDVFAGATHTPDFFALNPNGKVPVLQDGDAWLWESNAIMARVASETENTLWPKTGQRYDILRWMSWELAHFGPAADTIVFENAIKARVGMGVPDPSIVAEQTQKFTTFGAVLDRHLASQKYLSGSSLTLADFAVAAHLTYAKPGGLPLDDFPHVRAWNDRLHEVPAWRETSLRPA